MFQKLSYAITLLTTFMLLACSPEPHTASQLHTRQDNHSFANPEAVSVTHINLQLAADFDSQILSGNAQLLLEKHQADAKQLILDTRDLTIKRIYSGEQVLAYQLLPADKNLGSALIIDLPPSVDKVTIDYQTSPEASGLQWLNPAQTAGKQQPFLFSQAQAIHARSFIPLQDSPGVRVTYDAVIHTPPDLLAVMSAANDPTTPRDGEYHFHMPQAIPSYLIALAIGDLHFKAMGKRTGVYAEPAYLDAAVAEFSDTEAMLEAAEAVFGPYRWDRYDLLILPPSFPFGGMENPRLSFITPTVLAGDKSQVSLIAHELAHSWSGNTVTNATWRDLWLNEGFTTYLTYRIMELVFDQKREKMEFVLGYADLQEDIARLPASDQVLAIDLGGRDPDEVFSNIPYEKGALFLRELEQKIGRAAMDQFLLNYFNDHAFKSITTGQFVDYFKQQVQAKYPNAMSDDRLHAWLSVPGLPNGAPTPIEDAFSAVERNMQQWLNNEISPQQLGTEDWSFHHWMHFLRNLPDDLSLAQMAALDAAFNLTQSTNNEIAHLWLLLSIKHWYEPAFPRLHDYLVHIGRNKLVKPLYRELSKTPEGRVIGSKAFIEASPAYHPLTRKVNERFVTLTEPPDSAQ